MPSAVQFRRVLAPGAAAGRRAPVWTPLQLAALSEWWSVDTLAGAGDGDPVAAWAGKKGVYTPTASTTARPTYAADDGDGKPALLWDGVDDQMTCAIDDAVLYGPAVSFEAWFVLRGVAAGAVDRSFLGTNYGSTGSNFIAQATPRLTLYSRLRANFSNTTDLQDGSWHVVRVVMSDFIRKIFVDGVNIGWAYTDGTANAPGLNTLLMGGDGTLWLGGLRQVAFCAGLLSDDEAALMQAYMEGWAS